MADKGLCISNERICAIVEMNDPGVWTLGEVRKSVQARDMGIVVEYAGATASLRCRPPTCEINFGVGIAPPPPPIISSSKESSPTVSTGPGTPQSNSLNE